VNNPTLTDSLPLLFSLNWVMRLSSPKVAVHSSNQLKAVCSCTWLCAKTMQISGSSPLANSHEAVSSARVPTWSRVVFDRERVQVDDAEHRVGLVLVRDPLAEGAEVVADVRRAGRLHSREHPFHPCRILGVAQGREFLGHWVSDRSPRPAVTSLVWGTRSTPTYSRAIRPAVAADHRAAGRSV